MKIYFAFKLSDAIFFLLINVKMPTIDGILTFMSGINSMRSCIKHENKFCDLGAYSKFSALFEPH